jgi:hypothetical protein
MTVTIHFGARDPSALVRDLVDLAGGDKTLVRSSSRGLVVPDEVGYAYLAAHRNGNGHTPAASAPAEVVEFLPPPADTVDVTLIDVPDTQVKRRPGRPRKPVEPPAARLPRSEEPTHDI